VEVEYLNMRSKTRFLDLNFKVDQCYSNNPIMWTPILVWLSLDMRMYTNNVFKKMYIFLCLKEIGLRAQNMLTILDSLTSNIIEGPMYSTRESTNIHF
jgi:hypothetical protein